VNKRGRGKEDGGYSRTLAKLENPDPGMQQSRGRKEFRWDAEESLGYFESY
jgi:hypothetical protein